MKPKYLYVILCVKQSHPVDFVGREIDLKLDWAEGMCGVMPVFTNKKLAKKYAGTRYQIMQAQVIDNKPEGED